MISRRRFAQFSAMTAGAMLTADRLLATPAADIALEIAPYLLEASPKHHIRTLAYNNQVPGPLLRMRQGRPTSVTIRNNTPDPEIVHWHGLVLPSEIDGAMEEGTPMIAPGASTHYTLTPDPPGFRWYHTHVRAGNNLSKGLYSGLFGPLFIEPASHPGDYDTEAFLDLHDWSGHFESSNDGNMAPAYDVSTINGKMLGFGEPLRVKQGQRLLLHVLNSSATDVHWIAFAGHTFRVIALDGNPVASPQSVSMLSRAPAERVSALVELNNPGVWILGEVRKHIQSAGMGIVVEYANAYVGAANRPTWIQPEKLVWNYSQFASTADVPVSKEKAKRIDLVFDSKFHGHGAEEQWQINGKSYPDTDQPILMAGQRYRLVMKNNSMDTHPIHLHRHTFELRSINRSDELSGIFKDVVLAPPNLTTEVEFVANNPGLTLFHCHQQDHMDRGFMMVFRYA